MKYNFTVGNHVHVEGIHEICEVHQISHTEAVICKLTDVRHLNFMRVPVNKLHPVPLDKDWFRTVGTITQENKVSLHFTLPKNATSFSNICIRKVMHSDTNEWRLSKEYDLFIDIVQYRHEVQNHYFNLLRTPLVQKASIATEMKQPQSINQNEPPIDVQSPMSEQEYESLHCTNWLWKGELLLVEIKSGANFCFNYLKMTSWNYDKDKQLFTVFNDVGTYRASGKHTETLCVALTDIMKRKV